MFAEPIREIEKLHRKQHRIEPSGMASGSPISAPAEGELFDIRASFELGAAKSVALKIGDDLIVYDAVKKQLHGAPLEPVDGRISIQVLADRPMLEICGNQGAVFITSKRSSNDKASPISVVAEGDGAKLLSLDVYELDSIWGTHD
jgi:fructan beta-fructosidase